MKSPHLQLFSALAIFIAAAVGYGFWYTAVATKSTAVASIQAQIRTETATADRIASARAALAEIAGDEAAVQGYFVSQNAVVSFIDGLEALGSAQKTSVNVLSVSAGADASGHPALTLALTVTGSFDAMMRTVGAIEYAPYDLSIMTLSIAQNQKSVWQANLTLSVGSTNASAATSSPPAASSAAATPTFPATGAPAPAPQPI